MGAEPVAQLEAALAAEAKAVVQLKALTAAKPEPAVARDVPAEVALLLPVQGDRWPVRLSVFQ